jgi:2-polyprenyl-3-methyl-5-hydroxy-6-metoxy-1,4-benzoquinol methylase
MMISPITNSPRVEAWDSIPVADIVKAYQEKHQLDVSRHFRGLSDVTIGRCQDSGLRFYAPPETVGDDAFYQSLQKVFSYSPSLRWEHKRGLSHLAPGMKVLEIGCGPGVFLSALAAKGAQCTALELNSLIAETARSKGFTVHNQLISDHAAEFPAAYDAVCFYQVLEHVADVKPFLDAVLSALKPGGLVVIGVPHNNPFLYRYDKLHALNLPPHHMGLWDRESLTSLPRFFSMDLVETAIEPIYDASRHLEVLFRRWRMPAVARLMTKLPRLFDRIMGRTLGRFIEGRNILGVFRKRV